ncbi:MAG: dihydropteroate synthase [Alphaproteobacteria bacterium]|nr:hypothetical protein [Alphaproteobacteria bacterium]HIO02024.1 hypothetical protein [Alphaproteobacteria bacterium]
MKLDAVAGGELIVIGENIHTTRALRRKGKSIVENSGMEAVAYTDSAGAQRHLPVPDSFKRRQEYQQGQIKHVMIAVKVAMAGGDGSDEALIYLRQLVDKQIRVNADFLDLNVDEISWKLEEQKAAIKWLVTTIQGMTKLPLSIDSSNVEVIATGLAAYDSAATRPLLNSASLERIEALDLAQEHNARVVVTAAGESGMPNGAEERVQNASRMVDAALEKGFTLGDLFIDPLVFPTSVDRVFGLHCLEAIRGLRKKYGPDIHITGGISNASFGIPGRKLINEVFLILSVEAGADGGIIDPVLSNPVEVFGMNRDSNAYQMAEDVILGRDEFCQKYIAAWRKGKIGEAR